MAPVQIAETSKGKRAPKVLSHLELHPKMGGGHIVKHVYSGYQHDSKEYSFNKEGKAAGGEHIQSHLAKHAGLPASQGGAEEAEGAGPEEADD